MPERKRIVIIGAGFAGLHAARRLAKSEVDVLLIDRNNYHTFTPLLYQVATCGLDPSAVAYPIRTIFRKDGNVRFLLGEVIDINYDEQYVSVDTSAGEIRDESYDFLFVAAGSQTNYFGSDEIELHSFGLRDLDDALDIRHHILTLFEKAAWTDNEDERDAMMTLVVVGGGPTGIETAGALHELYSNVLDMEYDKDNKMDVRVILLEAMDSLLQPYPQKLQQSAKKQLESLGVEVRTGAFVDQVAVDRIILKDGTEIPTYTIVWATGVVAEPLAKLLDVELTRNGSLPITPYCEVIGRENIYAAGDISYLEDKNGNPYPKLIPVANQQGKLVADNILRRIRGKSQKEFDYFDRGSMATIGRSRAVAWAFNKIQLTGFVAWIAWLALHLIVLLGFRNRLQAFFSWVWDYVFYDRSVKLIVEDYQFESKRRSKLAKADEAA